MKLRFGRSLCGRDIVDIIIGLVFLSLLSGVVFIFDKANGYPVYIFSIAFIVGLVLVKKFTMNNKIMIVGDLVLVPGVALFNESRRNDYAYQRDMISINSKNSFASANFRQAHILSVDIVPASQADLSFWKRVRFVEGNPQSVLRISFKEPLERLMAPEGSPLRILSEISWKHHPGDPKEIFVSVRDPESVRRALITPLSI